MFEDFLVRALLAGSLLALVTGPLGCFVVWRRMAYLGDTIAHAGLLGVALSLLLDVQIGIGVFAVAALIAVTLLVVGRRATLSSDSLLGILSHSTLAAGLVVVSLLSFVRIDLMSYLFGDILAVTLTDIVILLGIGLVVLVVLAFLWRPLLSSTVSPELAAAEGANPELMQLALNLMLALVIALSIKLVGILLITAMLVIPAATARRFAGTPEIMAVLAALIGMVAVFGGLNLSLVYDTPSGASIVVAALLLFLVSLLWPRRVAVDRGTI